MLPTIFLTLLITLFPDRTALAFNQGPDIIRECAKCNAMLTQHTTMSGNTFGARIWTDGKMVAPMLPFRPRLVKCPKCKNLIWINEAKEIDEQYLSDKKCSNTVEPSLPSEIDFLTMLSAEKLDKDKEIYARRQTWMAANDTVREKDGATIKFSEQQQKNLLTLANLMDEENPDQRIAKAEIFRELGRFDECLTLLEKPFAKEHLKEVAAFIRQLAVQKSPIVMEIKQR
ncbi:MAG: hypothetical protein WCP55_22725 [Lentisphaerota bacterium]